MKANGYVHKYGDNVDTDVIIPARYLNTADHKELAAHCMEDIDKDFVKKVNSEIVFFVEDYPQLHPANVKRQHYMNRILKFIVPIAVSLALVYLISWLIH